MSTDRLEQRLPEVLADLSLPHVPDYVDDLLGRTARTPQRPGWTFPERWFPVSTVTATLPGFRRTSPRLLVILAILVTLAVASIALYAGSQRKLPPLFGLAANGLVVTADAGSIVTIDPSTGTRSALAAGTDLCCLNVAPDGNRVAYLHVPTDGVDPTGLTIARLDGSVVRDLPGDLLRGLTAYEWSPDGDSLLLANSDGLVSIDLRSGEATPIDLKNVVTSTIVSAEWIGTTGDILFSARSSDSAPLNVYRLTPGASEGPAQVATLNYAIDAPRLSPDGSRFLYSIWGPAERLHGRVHVFDLASGMNTAVTPEDEAANADPHAVEGPMWSPDGSLIAALWFGTGFDQLALIPAAGGSPVFVGPRLPENGLQAGAAMHFSPDGRSLLVWYGHDNTTWLLPVSGDAGTQVPWTIGHNGDDVGWQRLAPQ
jgi:Tol biopolymer transport system component